MLDGSGSRIDLSSQVIQSGAGSTSTDIFFSGASDTSKGYILQIFNTSPESIVGYSGGSYGFSNDMTPTPFHTGGVLVEEAPPSAVPEPSTLLLLGTGVIGLAGAVRERIARPALPPAAIS